MSVASSRSAAFALSISCAIFASISAAGAFSAAAAAEILASCACTQASALSPVTASTRRMPAATPPSATILKKPMSPVRATCVPPQSSRELPMSSTRTSSPYFSPNSIIAPVFCAASIGITRASVGALRRISLLTIVSTRRISSSVIGAPCAKSKRVLSESTSDPFCWTCAPSTSRNALCIRCVAEWLRIVRARAA